MTRKWRPPLALVLFGALASMLGLAFLGYIALRFTTPAFGWRASVAGIGALVTLIALVLAWLLARLILRPVRELAARAQEGGAAAQDRLEHYGTAELNEMGEAVRAMAMRLHSRAEGMRAYADHVTHELKSPLTTVAASAELLDDDGLGEDDRRELIGSVAGAARRMQSLLDALHDYARAGDSLRGTCADATPLLREAADAAGMEVSVSGPIEVPIAEETLRMVFLHLATNAASHGATSISVEPFEGGLTFSDNGSGVSEGNRSRIFDPFFTTRRATGGTGMGLPIVRRLLEVRGGGIELIPSPVGACFRIRFGVGT